MIEVWNAIKDGADAYLRRQLRSILPLIAILTIALFRKSSTHEEAKAPLLPAMSRLDPSHALPLPAPILQPVKKDDKKAATAPPATLKTLNQEQPKPPSKPPVNRSLTVTELPNTPIPAIELPKAEISAKAAPPPVVKVTNSPSLTLSGIAWSKDSSDRLAIINGQPAATGAMVNGSRVEEILPDIFGAEQFGRAVEVGGEAPDSPEPEGLAYGVYPKLQPPPLPSSSSVPAPSG